MLRHEKRYCENCSLHGSCGYVPRGLERKCTELGTYAGGYEQAIEDVKAVINRRLAARCGKEVVAGSQEAFLCVEYGLLLSIIDELTEE